jgi:hypothetical protein
LLSLEVIIDSLLPVIVSSTALRSYIYSVEAQEVVAWGCGDMPLIKNKKSNKTQANVMVTSSDLAKWAVTSRFAL